MKAFDDVSAVLDKLLSPEGCPWDREQTLLTLRQTVLEETCELIEAIDLDDNRHIAEELGDLFLNALFFCKIAERERRFTMEAVLQGLSDKLIRRHPHIFGDAKIADSDAVVKQWEELKRAEAHNQHRKSALDGIPKDLPALARAQKVIKRMAKTAYDDIPRGDDQTYPNEEATLGNKLLEIVADAQSQGIDAEQALRKVLSQREQRFRQWEVG